jgi:nicotinic acid phosphoribosyltransferase
MRDKPIIDSLLDTDFYKDTMGQMIFHRHPTTPVRYAFQNRHKNDRPAERIDLALQSPGTALSDGHVRVSPADVQA